jgi:ribonuclease Z
LDHIFISHLHGDHFFGLIGLLSTFHLIGRRKPLHLFAPGILKSLIEHHFEATNTDLAFPMFFTALEDYSESNLYEDDYLFVKAFPLKHSTPTWGFLVKEKERKRGLDKSFVEKYKPSVSEIKEILAGKGFVTQEGKRLSNRDITNKAAPIRSYAYCSDTAYEPSIIDSIRGVNLLYHEATFDNSMQEKAHEWLHATAAEAALIAKQAGAKQLLIGHFSNRHNNYQLLLDEARAVFDSVSICREGKTYSIV